MTSNVWSASSAWTRRRTLALLLSFALVFVAACTGPEKKPEKIEPPKAVEEKPVEIVILHTNDMHGQVLSRPYPKRAPDARSGGIAAIATLIRKERRAAIAAGKSVLLVDAGDIFQGTPEGNLTEGKVMVDYMNAVGYDACAIGNHEYDFGKDIPVRLSKRMRFPFLGANVIDEKTGERVPYLKSHTYKLLQGVNVLVLGMTTSHMKEVTAKGTTAGLSFRDEALCLSEQLKALNINQKGRVVAVLVGHLGLEKDKELAEKFPMLDVIIGGHSHTPIYEPEHHGEGRTLITQAGAKTFWLGRIDLKVDPKTQRVIESKGRLISVESEKIEPAPDLQKIVDSYAPQIAKVMDRVIGEAKADIVRSVGPISSPLGNFITDVMRKAGKADVAFQNKGGIRSDIPKGKIRFRNVYEVSPFGNTLFTMDLTGEQIRRAMELCLATDHSFLEISGMTCEHDWRKPEGQRVLKIMVGGQALELKKTYRVAVNSFLAGGGDKYAVFREGTKRVNTQLKLRDLQQQAVEAMTTLVPNKELRLKPVVPLPEKK